MVSGPSLGVAVQSWGGATFRWTDPASLDREGVTVWSVFPSTSDYFDPSSAPFMVNYRVADLTAVPAALRAEG
ncbi:MAG: VOC family protein, partial [Gammaproteobacteria bacterium]